MAARPDRYPVADTAWLLDLTDAGVRKRLKQGTLTAVPGPGPVRVVADEVDSERADLLRRLKAIDARFASDDECAELRAEIARLKAVVEDMAAATRSHLDAIEAATR